MHCLQHWQSKGVVRTTLSAVCMVGSMRESTWFNLVTSTDTSQCCRKCSAPFAHPPPPTSRARRHILLVPSRKAALGHGNVGICIVKKRDHMGTMRLDHEVRKGLNDLLLLWLLSKKFHYAHCATVFKSLNILLKKIKITAICFDFHITIYNYVSARYIPRKWNCGKCRFR